MLSASPYKLAIILSLGLMTGCLEDSSHSENSRANNEETCPTTNLISQRTSTTRHFGDGSDGEFYLAEDETFLLDEETYNFSNVYTELDSILAASNQAKDGTGKIVINSVGNCEFFGNIILADYNGTLEINCYSTLNLWGTINLGGTVVASTGSISLENSEVIAGEEFEFGSDSIIFSDISSAVISSGELTFSGVSTAETPTLELGETTIINQPSLGVVEGVNHSV